MEPLDAVLAALSDPTRRAIVDRLAGGEARVTAVAAPFGLSLAAVSKHIRVLERAGLVRRRVAGREHFLALERSPLGAAAAWIERRRDPWPFPADDFAALLEAEQAGAPLPRPAPGDILRP